MLLVWPLKPWNVLLEAPRWLRASSPDGVSVLIMAWPQVFFAQMTFSVTNCWLSFKYYWGVKHPKFNGLKQKPTTGSHESTSWPACSRDLGWSEEDSSLGWGSARWPCQSLLGLITRKMSHLTTLTDWALLTAASHLSFFFWKHQGCKKVSGHVENYFTFGAEQASCHFLCILLVLTRPKPICMQGSPAPQREQHRRRVKGVVASKAWRIRAIFASSVSCRFMENIPILSQWIPRDCPMLKLNQIQTLQPGVRDFLTTPTWLSETALNSGSALLLKKRHGLVERKEVCNVPSISAISVVVTQSHIYIYFLFLILSSMTASLMDGFCSLMDSLLSESMRNKSHPYLIWPFFLYLDLGPMGLCHRRKGYWF